MLSLALLCVWLMMFAKGDIKFKVKEIINPYTIKIEKIGNDGKNILLYGSIKQKSPFSYSVDFSDCALIYDDGTESISGTLFKWNEDLKIPFLTKPISDKKEDNFIIAFPPDSFENDRYFSLKLGTVQNKNRTELIIKNLILHPQK